MPGSITGNGLMVNKDKDDDDDDDTDTEVTANRPDIIIKSKKRENKHTDSHCFPPLFRCSYFSQPGASTYTNFWDTLLDLWQYD